MARFSENTICRLVFSECVQACAHYKYDMVLKNMLYSLGTFRHATCLPTEILFNKAVQNVKVCLRGMTCQSFPTRV